MALGVDTMRARRVVLKAIALTLGTAVFIFCLTLLSRSMRSVLDVGGACASGGAYEIRTPCPKGIAWIAPVSIFGMMFAAALSFFGVFSEGGPKPYVFAWSALFLALGWNFLDYGFNPPDGGTSASWLVCGFLFVAMGGAPLLLLFWGSAARWALWGPRTERRDDDLKPYVPPPTAGPAPISQASAPRAAGGLVRSPPSPSPAPTATTTAPAAGDVVTRLERLANLRERGLIDDDEYEIAKDKILGGEVGS